MKKRLSTSITFLWKFIFPTFWIGGFTIVTIIAFWEFGILGVPFLFGLSIGTTLLYFLCIRAKDVHMDNEFLYISNFRKTIKVPLAEIIDVTENLLINPRPIFVEFKNEIEFGRKIIFLGNTEYFLFFSTHPVVKELKSKIVQK